MQKKNSKDQPAINPPAKPLLIVLSGPSGAGKDAVLSKLRESGFPLTYTVTATTRAKRPNERDGVDYHFVSKERFQEMIAQDALLERANVYGNWYGVPKEPVREALSQGNDVILKIDIQGAATIKKLVPQAVFIFLTPPSIDDLVSRLKKRNTETSADLAVRTKACEDEIRQLPLFDYIVINEMDKIGCAVADIEAIITAEKRRVKPREISL
jgi:guanylate kinase